MEGVAEGSGLRVCGRVAVSEFRPHPLLRNAHLQTLCAALLRPRPALSMRRERVELPDGDFVDLGWSGGDRGPVAVLVHGLTGSLESKYLLGLALRLNALGWRTAGLEQRGAGSEPNRRLRYYNHGLTADLRHVLGLLRQREPATPLLVVGWSLGGNVLLKLLGEDESAAALDAAVAVCAPFDLRVCAERLRHGFSRVYQRHLLSGLRELVRRRHGPLALPPDIDPQKALAARDFFEFDTGYTAPLNGYRDAADYYARASSGPFLRTIGKPTLVIQALDDPFMSPAVPAAEELAPEVTLELSAAGGHVGFVAASANGGVDYWLESRITAFLQERLAANPKPGN